MPRFFYTENNHRQYRPPDNFWRKFLKYRQRKKTEIALKNTDKLNNPYQPKKQSAQKSNRRPFYLVGLILIVSAWIALIVYLPFFQIRSISFTGLETIRESEIKTVVNDYLNNRRWLPTKNFFIVRPKTLIKIITKAFSTQTVTIEKKFPNSLNISIVEKISSVIYDNGSDYYLLDRGGLIIKLLKTTNDNGQAIGSTKSIIIGGANFMTTTGVMAINGSVSSTPIHEPDYLNIKKEFGHYPIIYYGMGGEETIGQVVLKPEIIQTILKVSGQLTERGIGEIKYFVINNPSSGLIVKLDRSPFEIYLSVYGDLESQMNNIKIILQAHQPKEYLDVRYGERVYWK